MASEQASVAELASQLSAAVVIEAEAARRQRAADLRAQDAMRARAEAAEDTARQLQTELEQVRAALAAAKVDGEARRVANASLRSANASLRTQLADVKDRIAAAVVGMEPAALRDATNDAGTAPAAASSPQPQPRRESFSAKARTFAERLVAATQSGCDRSGRQFDMVVAALFRVHGYEAVVVDGPNDGGIDIRLWRDGVLSLVQCKCKSKRYKVCAEEVRRFAADVQEHCSELERESVAFFVTSTDYVREAAEVAPHMLVGWEGAPKLQLWGAHDLFCLALLHHDALRQDECAAARHAMLSLRTEERQRRPKCPMSSEEVQALHRGVARYREPSVHGRGVPFWQLIIQDPELAPVFVRQDGEPRTAQDLKDKWASLMREASIAGGPAWMNRIASPESPQGLVRTL